jgi:hypothetical protein
MKRRPVLATLGGLGGLGSLAGAGSTGPTALAGGDPGGAPPDTSGAVGGPAWVPTGLTEAARRIVLAGQTPYAVTVPGGGAPGSGAATALWRGDPAGGPWAPLAAPVPRVADLAAHPDDPRILYVAGDGGIHRSLDAGATWERVVVPLPSHAGLRVVVSPADPALLYATTGIFSGATIWRSQNGGAGWEALRNLQGTLCTWTFPVIAPDPAVRQRVYLSYSCAAGRTFSATLSASDDLWATDGATLLRPTVTSGAPLSFLFPAAAAFDPAGRRGVVVARRDARVGGSAVLGTDDGGASWRVLLNYPPVPGPGGTPTGPGTVATSLLAGDPEVRRLVVGLAGSGQGTLRSEDGGATWAGLGSPAIGRVDALAGDPAGVLYAATDRGVWRLSH